MNFINFKTFQSNFTFNLLEEIRVLKRINYLSNNQLIIKVANESLKEISFSNRKHSHLNFYKEVQYISFINCLLGLNINDTFDKLYNIMFDYNWNINDIRTIESEISERGFIQ